MAFIGWWEKVFTTIIGLVVFAFMLTFITCFPSKIKNYDGQGRSGIKGMVVSGMQSLASFVSSVPASVSN